MKFSQPRGDRWAIYDVLEDLAKQTKPSAYLEIGVSRGDSLKSVLSQHHPDLLVLCDEWGGESGGQNLGGHEHINDLLDKFNYCGAVRYLDGSSHEMIKKMWMPSGICREMTVDDFYGRGTGIAPQFDLITVDGDHSKEGAGQDLQDVWPLLRSGGYIVFDDISPEFFHPYLLKVWDDFCAASGGVEVYRNLADVHPPHALSHGVVVGQKI